MDTGTRRLFAVIVVALLLFAGVVWGLVSHLDTIGPWDGGGDGQGEDQWTEGVFRARGEAVWRDWNRTLPDHVIVEPGGHLRVVDSRIEVRYEDLVSRGGDWFEVRDGGVLELVRSELVLRVDPRLDEAYLNGMHRGRANIWRLVNLGAAIDPVLSLDIKWLVGETFAVVAIQRDEEAGLDPLGILEPAKYELGDWHHLEYSLRDYAGATPRVVIFLDNEEAEDLIISRLAVTDGDGPVDGDPFAARGISSGYWHSSAFMRFWDGMSWPGRDDPGLIGCMGTLRLTESEVRAAEGLTRSSPGTHVPHMSTVDPNAVPTNVGAATAGGDISLERASLLMTRSRVEYVPIIGEVASVDINGCRLVGDNDMITLASSAGSVVDTSFTFTDPGVYRGGGSGGIPWALSLEMGQTFRVIDCEFTGDGGTAIHLTNADVSIEGCSFSDQRLAVWNHQSELGMDWSRLNASNEFAGSCRYWYWHTHDLWIDFSGPGMPTWPSRNGDWIHTDYLEDPVLPFGNEHFQTAVSAVLVVPTLLTRPSGEEEYTNLSVLLDPGWTEAELISIDTSDSRMSAWFPSGFNGGDEDPWYEHFLDAYPMPGSKADTIMFVIRLRLYDHSLYNPRVHIRKGDLPAQEVPLNCSHEEWWGGTVVTYWNATLDEGVTNFSIHMTATDLTQGKRVSLSQENTTVYRVSRDDDFPDLSAVDFGSTVCIVVDPGTVIHAGGHSYDRGTYPYYGAAIVLGEGSTLVLGNVSLGPEGMMGLEVFGPGELRLESVSGYYVQMIGHDASMGFADCAIRHLDLNGHHTSFDIRGTWDGGIGLQLHDGSNLSMEGIESTDDDYMFLRLGESNVSLKDLDLRGNVDNDGALWIGIDGDANVDIRDCEFHGLVTIHPPWWEGANWTLNLTGCVFSGDDAYLPLVGREMDVDFDTKVYAPGNGPVAGTVSGNTFSGNGSGLIFDPRLAGGLLGENTFRNGARAWALYSPTVVFPSNDGRSDYNHTFIPGDGYTTTWPYSHYAHRWTVKVLVDVTDDPEALARDVVVPIMVRGFSHADDHWGVVVGFDRVHVTWETVTLEAPAWPHLGTLIDELVKRLTDDSSWWTSGGG